MVQVIQENRKPSYSSALGQQLGAGVSSGISKGMDFSNQMKLEQSKGRGLAQETKQLEKIKSLELGLGTIGQMREILQRNRLGRGSSLSALFSGEVRKDRAEYEQLGRSLIPLVAAGVPIRNQREFDEYKKVLTDPSASDDEIEGALSALEKLLERSASQGEDSSFSSKIMGESKKKKPDVSEPQQLINELPQEEGQNELGSGKSWFGAGTKGLIRGLRNFSPLPNNSAITPELAENLLERFLPSNEGGVEDVLEFTGENLPVVAGGRGGLIKKGIQALLGGSLKAGAKEINLPGYAQEAANITGLSAPSGLKAGLSKKLLPHKADKSVYDALKKSGFSDKEITPFVQSEKKIGFLSQFAKKTLTKDEIRKSLKDVGSELYSGVREEASKIPPLQGKPLASFIHDFEEKLSKIPKHHRKLVQSEVDELFSRPVTFNDLRDFEMLLNDKIKGAEGGKASVGILKEPLKKAQAGLDAHIFKEKELANKIYQKGSKFAEMMGKQEAGSIEKLVKWGPLGSAALGALTFNPVLLKVAGISLAAPVIAKQMLTNPRFYNVHGKLAEAVKNGNKTATLKLTQILMDELKKVEEEEDQ